ncbi:MAG: DUF72 domain-containing protein [Epsilonproteobacteria bacterium]|nr:DUF72 domain-containing protein [Campylobacterota bacterium]NPA64201.1 DUF72 domain-containing protein [Campylobacterota bacterium]
MIYIGTAGWSIPKELREYFGEGSNLLQRYATRLNVTEINRTFYAMPRASTFQKWAAETPEEFRFTLKLPRLYTHFKKLGTTQGLEEFCSTISHLGAKLLAILVQLPPSLSYEQERAQAFFSTLTTLCTCAIACEPRHESWIEAEELFQKLGIARVAADPPRFEIDKEPGGYEGFRYYRLHGSPKIYYSSYSEEFLQELAAKLRKDRASMQIVIFDNTASGAAFSNALRLKELVDETQ